MNSVVKYKKLMAPMFATTIQKLDSCKSLDGKNTYVVMRLVSDIDNKLNEVRKSWLALANRYAQADETKPNSFKLNSDFTNLLWKEDVNADEAKAAFEAFDNETYETKWRLKFDALEKAELCAAEFRAIEDLIEFPSDESQPTP